MNITDVNCLVSAIPAPRFQPYLAKAGNDPELALALYMWNTEVSAAVLRTLSFVEVAIRHTFDLQLQTWNAQQYNGHGNSFGKNWITNPAAPLSEHVRRNPRPGSSPDKSGLYPGWWEKKARTTMKDPYGKCTHPNPTHDDLVAALPFGLWVSLLPVPERTKVYSKKAPQSIYWKQIFSATENTINGSQGFNAKAEQAYRWCCLLRHARNRAAHLEPMLETPKLMSYHSTAINVLHALSSGFEQCVKSIAAIPEALKNKPH